MCTAAASWRRSTMTGAGRDRHVDQAMRGIPLSSRRNDHEREPVTGFFGR